MGQKYKRKEVFGKLGIKSFLVPVGRLSEEALDARHIGKSFKLYSDPNAFLRAQMEEKDTRKGRVKKGAASSVAIKENGKQINANVFTRKRKTRKRVGVGNTATVVAMAAA